MSRVSPFAAARLLALLPMLLIVLQVPPLPGAEASTAQPTASFPPLPGEVELVPKLVKPANARMPAEKDLAGYVMVYFKDETHSAYLAISRDGYHFTDVNGGNPVIDGKKVAEQHGVRDPYITRGPDGAFYLGLTDMHASGQQAGVRTTAWERPDSIYGWGNNRALVLMKSYDLIHWTAHSFRIDLTWPEQFGEVGCFWAPHMIFDEAAGKMMLSFTSKIRRGIDDIYWSYTDEDFTRLVTPPKVLLAQPRPAGAITDQNRDPLHVIDSDITRANGKYRMFYSSKMNGAAGIYLASSDKLTEGFTITPKRIDPETVNTEGPTMFRRLGTDKYVLMYDVYGAGNMGFSETSDFVTFTNLGRLNEGVMKGTNFKAPKHGGVSYLTLDELKAVAAHWKIDIKLD
jgi:sucrose-6-phosphate hydrolase SacC (GH32 family)